MRILSRDRANTAAMSRAANSETVRMSRACQHASATLARQKSLRAPKAGSAPETIGEGVVNGHDRPESRRQRKVRVDSRLKEDVEPRPPGCRRHSQQVHR